MDNTTIYEFLQEKSVTPTGPGSYSDSTEMSNALKVFKKNSSPKTIEEKDVNFYDYDGTLVDSYSTEEFLQLSTMPADPSHDGLTAQGWNYTLSDAKGYVSEYGKLDIGQMYITNDGKTRIHIKLEEERLKPRLGLGINGSIIIDWGDNSQTDTMTGSDLTTAVYQEHEYSAPGEYMISIAVTGEVAFLGDLTNGSQLLTKTGGDMNTNQVYLRSIKSVEVGSNVTSIGPSVFNGCYFLTSITIPNSVTSINESVFYDCRFLTSITIPSGVTSIGPSALLYCRSLTSITIPSSVTSIGKSAFFGCLSLRNITIPNGVTSINDSAFKSCSSLINITIPSRVTSIGPSAFFGCSSLRNITIPNGVTSINDSAFTSCSSLINITIPSSVTSIGPSAFSYCHSLTSITIPNGVTSINESAFSDCYFLTSITIPSGVTSIGKSAFNSCSSLINITIPSGVTSIGQTAFNQCRSLINITIPSGVTSIGKSTFNNCYSLGFIKFKGSTPPTVSYNANAWSGIPTDCIIYVPQGSLSAYMSASNYPSSSTYTYVEY